MGTALATLVFHVGARSKSVAAAQDSVQRVRDGPSQDSHCDSSMDTQIDRKKRRVQRCRVDTAELFFSSSVLLVSSNTSNSISGFGGAVI